MGHALAIGLLSALGLGILLYILKITGITYWKWWQKLLGAIAFIYLVPLLLKLTME